MPETKAQSPAERFALGLNALNTTYWGGSLTAEHDKIWFWPKRQDLSRSILAKSLLEYIESTGWSWDEDLWTWRFHV